MKTKSILFPVLLAILSCYSQQPLSIIRFCIFSQRLPTRLTLSDIRHTWVEYSPAAKDPLWVAYYLTGNEVEVKGKRYGKFEPDPAMPGGTATLEDYRRSGYDRGHQAPAADFKWNPQAEEETFLLSNICPQNSIMNRAIWEHLEKHVRQWAERYHRLYIVTGPLLDTCLDRIGERQSVRSKRIFQSNSRLQSRPLPGNCIYHAEYGSSRIRSDSKICRHGRFCRKDHQHSLFCGLPD